MNTLEEATGDEEENTLGGLSLDLCTLGHDADGEYSGDYQEIEATIDSGAAVCVFPRDMCSNVPVRSCAESRSGMIFRTASGEKVAHEGVRMVQCVTGQGLPRRLMGADTPVKR